MTLDERLKIAAQSYAGGYTCSQSVLSAFLEDMGLERRVAMRLMEGFGSGLTAPREVCGALSAAVCAVSCFFSNGQPGALANRQEVYGAVRRVCELFDREYGGGICWGVVREDSPEAICCGMRVKDAVLIAHQVMAGKTCARCAP